MTTSQRTTKTDLGLGCILVGALWDLMMTTIFFSVVDISDGLWFLLDAFGMASIAIGFGLYSRKTLPVAAVFGVFATLHVFLSVHRDGLDFLLGPADIAIALCGIGSAVWIARTEGWGDKARGVLTFTASILVIGLLLAIGGDTGLAWGLPLYSVLMLAAWTVLWRGSSAGPVTASV